MDIKNAALWIGMRILVAAIVYEIVGVSSFLDPSLSGGMRLALIAATPGSVELIAVAMWVLSDTPNM